MLVTSSSLDIAVTKWREHWLAYFYLTAEFWTGSFRFGVMSNLTGKFVHYSSFSDYSTLHNCYQSRRIYSIQNIKFSITKYGNIENVQEILRHRRYLRNLWIVKGIDPKSKWVSLIGISQICLFFFMFDTGYQYPKIINKIISRHTFTNKHKSNVRDQHHLHFVNFAWF